MTPEDTFPESYGTPQQVGLQGCIDGGQMENGGCEICFFPVGFYDVLVISQGFKA